MTLLAQILLQLLIILPVAYFTGKLFKRFGQPAVLGEICGGILLGPSFLGWVLPNVHNALFPGDSVDVLSILGNFGLIVFMFLIGLQVDTEKLKSNLKPALTISAAGIAVPFVLGIFLALFLFNDYAPLFVTRPVFCAFFGIALSITAFPVLARILEEKNSQAWFPSMVDDACLA